MKKIILTISIFLIIISNIKSQSGWVQQNSGTTQLLFSVFFVNAQTGWAVGNEGIIINTTTGGTNWEQQYSSGYNFLRSVYFLNSQTGWAVGYYAGLGRVLKTTNGGLNWIPYVNNSLGWVLTNIQFINENTGWACGSSGNNYESTILKTINSGQNWTLQYDSVGIGGNSLFEIQFLNSNSGYSVGWNNQLLKTTNGGTNWYYQNNNVFGLFNTLTFLNSSTGFIGGSDIYSTHDGGNNWSQYGTNYNVKAMKIIDQNVIYGAGSAGKIIKTTNGGTNWNVLTSNTTEDLYSIFFLDSYIGWCVGANGKILKTITGGITNINELSTTTPISCSLSQNYPNPFNPSTNIKFDVPKLENIRITIFDAIGREIETLVNEKLASGTYESTWDGSKYSSGIYFYRFQTGEYSETKRMILIK